MNVVTEHKNNVMKKEIKEKQDVVSVYNEYIQVKELNDKLSEMDGMTEVPNSAFLDFIAQMEEKMPSDLMVSNLSASADGITMSVTTKSKESAAEAIMQLRTFDCLGNIECSGVSEQEDDNGGKQETFDISVTYDTSASGEDTQDGEQNADTQSQEMQSTQQQ